MIDPPPALRKAGIPNLHQEDALGVDRHGQVPDLLIGRDGVVVGGVHDPGVVEQHVEAPEFRLGRGDHGSRLLGLGDIGLDGDGLAAVSGDDPGGFVGGVVVQVDGNHRCPLRGEEEGGLAADPGTGPGDESDFVSESHEKRSRCVVVREVQ